MVPAVNRPQLLLHLLGEAPAHVGLQIPKQATRDGRKFIAPSPVLDSADRDQLIAAHLAGKIPPRRAIRLDGTSWLESRGVAIHTFALRGDVCGWIALDIDSHGDCQDGDAALAVAIAAYQIAERAGLCPVLERSHGGRGWHVWVIFANEQPAGFAHWTAKMLAAATVKRIPKAVIEAFPKQAGGVTLGSSLALPFPGRPPAADGGRLVWPDLTERAAESVDLVTNDVLVSLLARWQAADALHRARVGAEAVAAERRLTQWRERHGHLDAVEQCRRYLARIPGGRQGEGGDGQTFRAATAGGDFGLTAEQFLPLLESWNHRCDPAWSHKELLQKVRSAERYRRHPIGFKLRNESHV